MFAAPGHDPHSVVLFDAQDGVLISADALWANGFGVVFPELDGEGGFDDVAAVFDLIERLAPRVVIPGHGTPFADVHEALARARSRSGRLRGRTGAPRAPCRQGAAQVSPARGRRAATDELLAWALSAELVRGVMDAAGPRRGLTPEAWCAQQLDELVGAGVLARDGGMVRDCG